MAFAFCHLLGFRLLPRLKDIASQKLARPEAGNPSDYEHLQPILSKPIDWDLIKNQYDEMIKFATALRLGTAETEAILRRFTRNNLQHPTYALFTMAREENLLPTASTTRSSPCSHCICSRSRWSTSTP